MQSDDNDAWNNYANALITVRMPGRMEPTLDNILSLAPHLTAAQAVEIQDRGCGGERTYFVGPPLRIHGAVQVFCVDAIRLVSGVYGPPMLYHAYVARRPESFVNHPELKKQARKLTFDHLEPAEDYACQNWPDEMVWDEAVSVMEGRIIQPGPDYVAVARFTAWLDEEFPDVLAQVDEPTCEIIDDALLEISLWEPSRMELQVGRMPFVALHCQLCGGGIENKSCTFCDAHFNIPNNMPAWPYAMPRAIEGWYRAIDYEFKINPVEARKAEHRKWAEPGFVPQIPTEFLTFGKQQRSIDL